jgi:hypothetical protein
MEEATTQNVIALATWRPRFAHPCSRKTLSIKIQILADVQYAGTQLMHSPAAVRENALHLVLGYVDTNVITHNSAPENVNKTSSGHSVLNVLNSSQPNNNYEDNQNAKI